MRKVFEFELWDAGGWHEIFFTLADDKDEVLEKFYDFPGDPCVTCKNEWSLESFVELKDHPEKWLANIKLHERFFIFAVKVFNWIADRGWSDA